MSEGFKKLKKSLDKYVKKHPLPSRVENLKKFRELRRLKKVAAKQREYLIIRNNLILSNGGFGMKYAIRYCQIINDDSIIEDIFQQAQIGIIEAVDRFNPNRGVNFTTFAFHYVRKCIIDFIKNNKAVPAPRDMARNIRNVATVADELYTKSGGKKPATKDIKTRLKQTKDIDIKESTIEDILQLIDLNSAATDDSFLTNAIDNLFEDDRKSEFLLFKSIVTQELGSIQDQDLLEIIKLRFGIEHDRPFSLQEIAIIKQLSPENIEQIKEQTRLLLNKASHE
jgi:RNA polymerase primary sigma factor